MSSQIEAPNQKWMRHLRTNRARQAALLIANPAVLAAPGPGAPLLRESLAGSWQRIAGLSVEPESVQAPGTDSPTRRSIASPEAVAAFLQVLGEASWLGRGKAPPSQGDGLLSLIFAPGGARAFRYYQEQRRLVDIQTWHWYAYPDQLDGALRRLLA